MDSYTARDILILAAATLGETFTEADLTVACWRLAPGKFGMRGFLQHPDVKRVSVELSTKFGAVRSGRLERVGPLTYRLTEAGRTVAERLKGRKSA